MEDIVNDLILGLGALALMVGILEISLHIIFAVFG